MTRSRKLAELAAAYQAGNPLSFRNKLINGNGIFSQRGAAVNNTLTPVYAADRWLTGCVGGTGLSISVLSGAFSGSSSGKGIYINGSGTNATPYFAQRIEAQNCQDMNGGKYVTLTGLLYQDTGSTITFTPRISKAGSVDNFSTGSALQSGTPISVPSGVPTPFGRTFLLGSTDATNGLMVELFTTNTVTFSGKYFGISDVQFEPGFGTTFENRHVGTELALCQRYYWRQDGSTTYGGVGSGYSLTTTQARIYINHPMPMRASPTYSYGGTINIDTAGGAPAVTVLASSFTTPLKSFLDLTVASGLVAGQGAALYAQNGSANNYIQASAEL